MQRESESLFIAECTPRYPTHAKLQEPLRSTHQVFRIVAGPEDHIDERAVHCCFRLSEQSKWRQLQESCKIRAWRFAGMKNMRAMDTI